MTTKLPSEIRTEQLIQAAITIASSPGGWHGLTREAVAARAGVSAGLVSQRCGTMENFKRDVIRHAIKAKHWAIIAQAIAAGDKRAKRLPKAIQVQALQSLAG